MKITLYLSVATGNHHDVRELWIRTLTAEQAPRKGDEVMIFGYGTDIGLALTATRAWMNATDGSWVAELQKVIVDPSGPTCDYIARNLDLYRAWWSGEGGTFDPTLRAAGWQTYREVRRATEPVERAEPRAGDVVEAWMVRQATAPGERPAECRDGHA